MIYEDTEGSVEVLTYSQREENFQTLLKLCQGFCPSMVNLMLGLKDDRFAVHDIVGISSTYYLGMMNAPAGKGVHHAYKGGLVKHLLEMWEFWKVLKNEAVTVDDPLLNDQNVFICIMIHDLHKAWCTFVEDVESKSGVNYGKHPSNSLLTNDQKTAWLLSNYDVKLNIYLMNCLYSSEGGFADSPPRWQTTLAKLVYTLDELSSNVLARSEAGNRVDHATEGFVQSHELNPNWR